MHERRGADALRSWAIPSDKPGRYQARNLTLRPRGASASSSSLS